MTATAPSTALVVPPPPAPLAAVEPDLHALVDEEGHDDVLAAVRDLVLARGYTEDDNFAALNRVAQLATRKVKLLTLRVIAPVVYEMRRTRGFARLVNPKTGDGYPNFDDWAQEALGLSHTRATNLCTVWSQVLPLAVAQGWTAADLEAVDESKLMLIAPLTQEHQREVERIKREADVNGKAVAEDELPPPPDVREVLDFAKDHTWAQVREQVLTLQGVQKEDTGLDLLVERTDDGRYNIYGRLTREQMLRVDEKLKPRWLDGDERPVQLYDELRQPAAPTAAAEDPE